jgi:hypothetical protein
MARGFSTETLEELMSSGQREVARSQDEAGRLRSPGCG